MQVSDILGDCFNQWAENYNMGIFPTRSSLILMAPLPGEVLRACIPDLSSQGLQAGELCIPSPGVWIMLELT